jgi:hypothetical protein
VKFATATRYSVSWSANMLAALVAGIDLTPKGDSRSLFEKHLAALSRRTISSTHPTLEICGRNHDSSRVATLENEGKPSIFPVGKIIVMVLPFWRRRSAIQDCAAQSCCLVARP